jgi:hypothetical protein
MNRLTRLTAIILMALALAVALTLAAQSRKPASMTFASDDQTVAVMANTVGVGGAVFQTYVNLLNPTSERFSIEVTLYDAAGTEHDASITLGPGEQKTYTNFLDTVFHFTGGGAVTFHSAESVGGTHNNRFIVSTEIRTAGARYGTTIPALEFAGSSSRSFSPGVTVDANTRTNVGCYNESEEPNRIRATVYDSSGTQNLGSVEFNLAGDAWGQLPLSAIVTNGFVQFDPEDSAVCYAVVVDNATNDGRFISAAEYQP